VRDFNAECSECGRHPEACTESPAKFDCWAKIWEAIQEEVNKEGNSLQATIELALIARGLVVVTEEIRNEIRAALQEKHNPSCPWV